MALSASVESFIRPSSQDQPHECSPFDHLTDLNSNREALSLAKDFIRGKAKFVLIIGPKGWGKTQLLRCVAQEVSKKVGYEVRPVGSLDAFLHNVETTQVLILDDFHALEKYPKSAQKLFRILERRIKTHKPTIVALSESSIHTLRNQLPLWGKWQKATLKEPDQTEREQILQKLCRETNVSLSPDCIKLIARAVQGDAHSLQGALKRVQIAGSCSQLDFDEIRVAGLLDAVFVKQHGFDLREMILDSVSQSFPHKMRRVKPNCCWMLSVYIMRDRAGISEERVAQYFGLTPNEVFKLQKQCADCLSKNETIIKEGLEKAITSLKRKLYE